MSPINSRAKGDRCEREVVALITELTGYHVSRTRSPGYQADVGDLHGVPNTIIEVKGRKSIAESINEGLPQAAAAAARTGDAWPTVWARRPGGRYVVCMEPETFAALHREATS